MELTAGLPYGLLNCLRGSLANLSRILLRLSSKGYFYHGHLLPFNPGQQECGRAVMVPKFEPVKHNRAHKLCLRL